MACAACGKCPGNVVVTVTMFGRLLQEPSRLRLDLEAWGGGGTKDQIVDRLPAQAHVRQQRFDTT